MEQETYQSTIKLREGAGVAGSRGDVLLFLWFNSSSVSGRSNIFSCFTPLDLLCQKKGKKERNSRVLFCKHMRNLSGNLPYMLDSRQFEGGRL